jgi:hypothetical protein
MSIAKVEDNQEAPDAFPMLLAWEGSEVPEPGSNIQLTACTPYMVEVRMGVMKPGCRMLCVRGTPAWGAGGVRPIREGSDT